MTLEFVTWAKIPRFNKPVEITEKIDGTNGILYWCEDEHLDSVLTEVDGLYLYAGSRNRWLTPASDNFGFAVWALENAEGLRALGRGRHFGEWWGLGIQRRYDQTVKRFSLFDITKYQDLPLPENVDVVPRLITIDGSRLNDGIRLALEDLKVMGSMAAPGFTKPEGIVVRHTASGARFKILLEGDETPKSLQHTGVASA